MPKSLMPIPKQAFTAVINGKLSPAVGYKIYTYKAGTTTPKKTWTTAAGNVENANPVILDARGECSIFLSVGKYKIVFTTSDGDPNSPIWSQDNVSGSASYNTYDTVTDLLAVSGTFDNEMAKTLGYYSIGDRGGNEYYWSGSSSSTHNGATVIKPTAVSGNGRWLAVKFDSVLQGGIVGDGATNDTAQWGKILALGTSVIRIPENCLISTDPFTISAGKIIEGADNQTSGFIFRDSSATYNMDLRNLTAMRFYNCIFYWNNATAQPRIFLSAAGSTDFEFCYNRVIGDAAITNMTRCIEAQSGSTLRPKINYNIINNVNCDVIRPAGATNFEVIGNQITGVGRRTAGSGANRAIIAGQGNYGIIANNVIKDVTGDNCYAMDIGGATNITVTGNNCQNVFGGIDLEGGSDSIVITGNVFNGPGLAGGWGDRGIFINSNQGTSSFSSITGNTVSGFQRGISCTGLKKGAVTGNAVTDCAMFGIFSNIGYDSTIGDNTVADCGMGAAIPLYTSSTPPTYDTSDTATGSTSGATAKGYKTITGTPNAIWVSPVSGTFTVGETVTLGSGSFIISSIGLPSFVTLYTATNPATAPQRNETATGGSSGATGTVVAFNSALSGTNELWLKPLTGTFTAGETVTFTTGNSIVLSAGTQNANFSGIRWNNLFAGFSGNTITGNTVSGINHLYSFQGYNNSAGANDAGDWDIFANNKFKDKPLSLIGKIRANANSATGGASKTIFADGDTSPSVAWGHIFYTANTGATTITNFDDAPYDTEIMVYFGDANTTLGFSGGATLRGNGGVDKTFAAGDAMHARKVRNPGDTSSFWYCTLILK